MLKKCMMNNKIMFNPIKHLLKEWVEINKAKEDSKTEEVIWVEFSVDQHLNNNKYFFNLSNNKEVVVEAVVKKKEQE